jgi:hypothetical protein
MITDFIFLPYFLTTIFIVQSTTSRSL